MAREIYYDRMKLLSDGQELCTGLELSAIYAESYVQFVNRIKQMAYTSTACSEVIKEYFNVLFSNIQIESEGLN